MSEASTESQESKPRKSDAGDKGGTATAKKQSEGKKSGSRGALLLALLALLLAAASAAGVAWLWYQGTPGQQQNALAVAELDKQIEQDLGPELEKLSTQQATQAKQNAAQADRVAALEKASERQEATTAELSELVQGGRLAWRLLEVDHLLQLANDRALLARDIEGAIDALEVADQRLGRIAEPRLLPVRRQIVEDIAALQAVPEPDRAGIALRLSSLINRIPELPLRYRVPGSFESTEEAAEVVTSDDEDRWQRMLSTLREAWRGLVHVRHNEQRIEPLLPPDQEFFLRQNLTLKLEAAYLALMQGDTERFQQSVKRAVVWLGRFYDRDEATVKAAMEQLSEVAKLELAMPLPDLSRSLEMLRSMRPGVGGVRARAGSAVGNAQPAAAQQEGAGGE